MIEEERGEPGGEELIARFLAARARGESADVEAFARRHPEHAEELRNVLDGFVLMEKAGEVFDAARLDTLARIGRARRSLSVDAGLARPTSAGNAAADDFVAQVLAQIQEHGGSYDRYSSEGETARGGQGVLLVVNDETLRRRVAMKVARTPAEDGEAKTPTRSRSLARFLEEAQVTAQLDHPGIVPVYDMGLDPSRRVYFTMKLVRGRDLGAIFELVRKAESEWSQTRVLHVLLKVCEAMAYAHSKGVIHRDLKPSNVMVGAFGEVYVMDWGLARVQGRKDERDLRIRSELTSAIHSLRSAAPEDLDSPLVTMDGDVVGTPVYMSPEQARGELEAMGPHSDVYGIGAMLYQLLTGQMPYVAPGSRLGVRAVWELVQRGPPMPLHALAADVPAELEAICEKAMAREPSARYADTSRLAEDLRAYLEHRVVGAYETGALAELRKWVGRNRGLAAALVAGIVLAVGGLAGVGYVQAEGKRVADAERANVLRLSAFQELEDLEREADGLWPPDPGLLDEYEDWLRRARALVAGLESNPDGTSGGHRAQLAELQARALPYTEAERAADRGSNPRLAELETRKKKLEAFRKAQAVREGKAQAAEVPLDETLRGADPSLLNNVAWVLVMPDRTAFGEEARALALARRATSIDNPNAIDRANNLDTLAWALFANGLDQEALETSARALGEAPLANKEDFQASMERLRTDIEAASANAAIPLVEQDIRDLEVELARRVTWSFESQEDLWWHAQLRKLIAAVEAFADPKTGSIRGLSREHGWGIERRLARAAALEKETVSGADVARRWAEAIDALGDPARCPAYDGLVLEPQLGLVPIGRDRDSGLWEFVHALTGTAPARDADGRLVLTADSGLVFVLLPGGSFAMGAQSTEPAGPNYDAAATPDEFPVHTVTLRPFFVSKYEVTQAQWLRCTGQNPSWTQLSEMQMPLPLHPVEQVSWSDCLQFCTRMGLELPTEAQWEYAARGGTTSVWWTGKERESLVGAVNLAGGESTRAKVIWPGTPDWPELDDGYVYHAPVDRLRANPFGLHHAIGNLWEWCLDYFDRGFYTRSSIADPVAPRLYGENRVTRGSSYRNTAWLGRSSFRNSYSPEARSLDAGFRPARTITGEIRYRAEPKQR